MPRQRSSTSFVELNGKLYVVELFEHECKGSILMSEGNVVENNELFVADGVGGGAEI